MFMGALKFLTFIVLLLLIANCAGKKDSEPGLVDPEPQLTIKGLLVVSLVSKGGIYELRVDTVQEIGDPLPPPVDGYKLVSQIPAGNVLGYE